MIVIESDLKDARRNTIKYVGSPNELIEDLDRHLRSVYDGLTNFVKFDGDDRWTLFSLLTLTMMAAKAVIDGKAGNMDEAKNIVAKDIVKNAVNSFGGKETDDDRRED